VILGKLKKYIV